MVESILEFPELNGDNVVGIIYNLLNAESLDVDDHNLDFKMLSSRPMTVNGVEYHSCALIRGQSRIGTALPIIPHYEMEKLYDKNPQQRDVFWQGVERVLEDLYTNSETFSQPYSRAEFLESFYNLGRTSPPGVSDRLRKIVDNGGLKKVDMYEWFPKEYSPNKDISSIRSPNDTHYYVVRALAVHQQGLDCSYWLKQMAQEREYFLANFTGLGHRDIKKAEEFLEKNRGRMPWGNDLVERRLMGIKRRIVKP